MGDPVLLVRPQHECRADVDEHLLSACIDEKGSPPQEDYLGDHSDVADYIARPRGVARDVINRDEVAAGQLSMRHCSERPLFGWIQGFEPTPTGAEARRVEYVPVASDTCSAIARIVHSSPAGASHWSRDARNRIASNWASRRIRAVASSRSCSVKEAQSVSSVIARPRH